MPENADKKNPTPQSQPNDAEPSNRDALGARYARDRLSGLLAKALGLAKWVTQKKMDLARDGFHAAMDVAAGEISAAAAADRRERISKCVMGLRPLGLEQELAEVEQAVARGEYYHVAEAFTYVEDRARASMQAQPDHEATPQADAVRDTATTALESQELRATPRQTAAAGVLGDLARPPLAAAAEVSGDSANRLASIPALDTESPLWIRNTAAAAWESVQTDTLKGYRNDGCSTPDGMAGIDPAGRMWRKPPGAHKPTHPWYYKPSLRRKC